MTQPPETSRTNSPRVACMGASDVAGTALGHPRVWLQIDSAIGYADCGYCDRRFILAGGPADLGQSVISDDGHDRAHTAKA
ncbi:zinc-finger domain-containing protein [Sphingomonas lacunae]|uniref:Zinc-finger domain-containing protein n=1 Tax=Sphingomonas lacunae TaxID=2698828 RepID=A0A6M4ASV2_9SPHN|nr:zinc-finger domain-containing protein [Sphingomonas lacunae]QJQ32178.1 zinc-finger domain-containing protein [Sphingomonas lacunae]